MEFFPPGSVGGSPQRTKHYETKHFSNQWRLDMKKEISLGLMPADWSTSSQMNDPRPNGRSMFDARFVESPMGRARGGRAMVWDARGTKHAGGTKAAENWDSAAFAVEMSDETAAAEASADKNKFGNNTNMAVFQSNELATAGMSALQRARDTCARRPAPFLCIRPHVHVIYRPPGRLLCVRVCLDRRDF